MQLQCWEDTYFRIIIGRGEVQMENDKVKVVKN